MKRKGLQNGLFFILFSQCKSFVKIIDLIDQLC
jgi:hypothetical protein